MSSRGSRGYSGRGRGRGSRPGGPYRGRGADMRREWRDRGGEKDTTSAREHDSPHSKPSERSAPKNGNKPHEALFTDVDMRDEGLRVTFPNNRDLSIYDDLPDPQNQSAKVQAAAQKLKVDESLRITVGNERFINQAYELSEKVQKRLGSPVSEEAADSHGFLRHRGGKDRYNSERWPPRAEKGSRAGHERRLGQDEEGRQSREESRRAYGSQERERQRSSDQNWGSRNSDERRGRARHDHREDSKRVDIKSEKRDRGKMGDQRSYGYEDKTTPRERSTDRDSLRSQGSNVSRESRKTNIESKNSPQFPLFSKDYHHKQGSISPQRKPALSPVQKGGTSKSGTAIFEDMGILKQKLDLSLLNPLAALGQTSDWNDDIDPPITSRQTTSLASFGKQDSTQSKVGDSQLERGTLAALHDKTELRSSKRQTATNEEKGRVESPQLYGEKVDDVAEKSQVTSFASMMNLDHIEDEEEFLYGDDSKNEKAAAALSTKQQHGLHKVDRSSMDRMPSPQGKTSGLKNRTDELFSRPFDSGRLDENIDRFESPEEKRKADESEQKHYIPEKLIYKQQLERKKLEQMTKYDSSSMLEMDIPPPMIRTPKLELPSVTSKAVMLDIPPPTTNISTSILEENRGKKRASAVESADIDRRSPDNSSVSNKSRSLTGEPDSGGREENTDKTTKEDGTYDPTIENILKSIGFNFELSKLSQEKAKREREQVPEVTPDSYGVEQDSSFLAGGLKDLDRKAVFEADKKPVTKRMSDAKKSTESYEERAKRYLVEQMKLEHGKLPSPPRRGPSPIAVKASLTQLQETYADPSYARKERISQNLDGDTEREMFNYRDHQRSIDSRERERGRAGEGSRSPHRRRYSQDSKGRSLSPEGRKRHKSSYSPDPRLRRGRSGSRSPDMKHSREKRQRRTPERKHRAHSPPVQDYPPISHPAPIYNTPVVSTYQMPGGFYPEGPPPPHAVMPMAVMHMPPFAPGMPPYTYPPPHTFPEAASNLAPAQPAEDEEWEKRRQDFLRKLQEPRSKASTSGEKPSKRTVLPPAPRKKVEATGERQTKTSVSGRAETCVMSEEERKVIQLKYAARSGRIEELNRELGHLKKQQNEMMRKKQREKDGHKDPQLAANSKLQEKIAEQIKILRKAADESAQKLDRDGSVLEGENRGSSRTGGRRKPSECSSVSVSDLSSDSSPSSSSSPARQSKHKNKKEQDKHGKAERKDSKKTPTEKAGSKENVKKSLSDSVAAPQTPDSTKAISYEYFDGGKHMCRLCITFCSSTQEFLNHLASSEHSCKMDQKETPWAPKAKKSTNKVVRPALNAVRLPFKGVEFMIPVAAFYCRLCGVFSGDVDCASDHLKSPEHNSKYKAYIQKNPSHEENQRLATHSKPGQVRSPSRASRETRLTSPIDDTMSTDMKATTTGQSHEQAFKPVSGPVKSTSTTSSKISAAVSKPGGAKFIFKGPHLSTPQTLCTQSDEDKGKIAIKLAGKMLPGSNPLEAASSKKREVRPTPLPPKQPAFFARSKKLLTLRKEEERKLQAERQEKEAAEQAKKSSPQEEAPLPPAMANTLDMFLTTESGHKLPEMPNIDEETEVEMKEVGIDPTSVSVTVIPKAPPPLASSGEKPCQSMASSSASGLYNIFYGSGNSSKNSTVSSECKPPASVDDIPLPPVVEVMPNVEDKSGEEESKTDGEGESIDMSLMDMGDFEILDECEAD